MNRKPPLARNQEITLSIDALGSEGQGIGRYEGFAVFVPGALPTERVNVHVIKVNPGYAVAKLLSVEVPSKDRVTPRCSAFPACGGCTLEHLSYEAQLLAKQRQVYDALTRLGGLTEPTVLPVIGMDEPWKFRNKGAFSFALVNGVLEVGAFAPRSHRLIALSECPIEQDAILDAALAVRDWAREYHIAPYDEETGRGTLRHIVARTAKNGAVMAVAVTTGKLPHREELISALRERVPGLQSIIHNINKANTNVILGSRYETLFGTDALTETVAGHTVQVSAASFLQVNPVQTERLYETALAFSDLHGGELALDVYCGTGTISMLLAERAKSVIGIESVPEAVEDAKRNAKANGFTNLTFTCALAEEELPRLAKNGLQADVVTLDPPRKGAEEAMLLAVVEAAPARIVYVSCNPATLARDVKILTAHGYEFQKAQPVDMFPHSAHVETVVLLSKGGISTEKIRVEFSMDDMDLADLKGKATYPQIKEYVLKTTGLKVSSLYISQTKRKCGLDVGESYNKPKSDDSKQPQCPPEKEEAITEALRHFGMI